MMISFIDIDHTDIDVAQTNIVSDNVIMIIWIINIDHIDHIFNQYCQ